MICWRWSTGCLAAQAEMPSVNGVVTPAAITIADQMGLIEREDRPTGRSISFRRLLERTSNRVEIIVTLLAVLEMIKQLRIIVRQDRLFGEIEILRRSQTQPARPDTAPNASNATSPQIGVTAGAQRSGGTRRTARTRGSAPAAGQPRSPALPEGSRPQYGQHCEQKQVRRTAHQPIQPTVRGVRQIGLG